MDLVKWIIAIQSNALNDEIMITPEDWAARITSGRFNEFGRKEGRGDKR